MPTSTTLSTLNINKLTRAQYDTAVQGGVIGPTDLSIITDENFDAVPQFTTLPTASADNVGEVVQYIGASDATYTHNYFYECIEDSGTYSWNQTNVQPDYNTNDYTALLNKPSINNVVLSGNKTAADLSLLTDVTQGSNISIDKTNPANPVISATGQVNSDWNSNSGLSQILNKPSLSTVATTGSYNDLSNKPTIPAAQVNSDWNSNSGVSQILNKPTLATVATSGNYSDLSGTPTIPTVNNPTITITQGGVTKGSFTLNQASGDTIALDAGGGGGSVNIDNVTITENLSQEIQAVGTVNANSSNVSAPNVFDWVGTLAQYTSQNIASTHPDWVCYITDDEAPVGHNIIAFQEPTALNNYTWYRLYADGWVEQGGNYDNGSLAADFNTTVTFPIEMANTRYTATAIASRNNATASARAGYTNIFTHSATQLGVGWYRNANTNETMQYIDWSVSGMAA